ncbi:hypothetical protein D9758_001536 [Tetrapyrgos nigripes]|uniref:F-box domain-containing protein n=1 Tax=Tetrapyrgos nigripes TaxID=182062 RepID=A0A8H5GX47_9AGAR|nr:hypothetical protein D9758_001536 [Tetrapyrgos nigripes]
MHPQLNDPDISSFNVLAENTNATIVKGGKRLRNLKSRTNGHNDGDASDDDDNSIGSRKKKRVPEEASTGQGQRGRQKKAVAREHKRVRGRRGLLQQLVTEVPIELILEVFKYLDPLDILHLSRTSKDLRGILMSRSSADIWEAARANVEDLPPLPSDLNEPQYASLAFDSFCHNCMRNGCENIIWQARVRLCVKCIPDVFCPWPEIAERFPVMAEDSELEEVCHIVIRLCTLHLDCELEHINSPWRDCERAFLPSDAEEIIKDFLSRLNDKDFLHDWEAWLKAQNNHIMTIRKHALDCVRWHQSRIEERLDKLAEAKRKRREAIIEKLDELGLGNTARRLEDEYGDPFSRHKLVNQSRQLSERVWNNIKEPLVELLTEQKIRHEGKDRVALLKNTFEGHRNSTDPSLPVPTFGDAVLNHLHDDLYEVVPGQMDGLIRERLLERLPLFFSEWRAKAERKVLDILQKKVSTATLSDLDLAKTMFHCMKCNERIWYTDLFRHPCAADFFWSEQYPDCDLPKNACNNLFRGPWLDDIFEYAPKASRKMTRILEACGMDPSTTTLDDLHIQNPMMECMSCLGPSPEADCERVFMRWDRAVSSSVNFMQVMKTDLDPELLHHCGDIVALDNAALQQYQDRIQQWDYFDLPLLLERPHAGLYCNICYRRGTPSEIREHLENDHGVTQMSRQHFRWSPGICKLFERCSKPLVVIE